MLITEEMSVGLHVICFNKAFIKRWKIICKYYFLDEGKI